MVKSFICRRNITPWLCFLFKIEYFLKKCQVSIHSTLLKESTMDFTWPFFPIKAQFVEFATRSTWLPELCKYRHVQLKSQRRRCYHLVLSLAREHLVKRFFHLSCVSLQLPQSCDDTVCLQTKTSEGFAKHLKKWNQSQVESVYWLASEVNYLFGT